jgi:hypothetical protein
VKMHMWISDSQLKYEGKFGKVNSQTYNQSQHIDVAENSMSSSYCHARTWYDGCLPTSVDWFYPMLMGRETLN